MYKKIYKIAGYLLSILSIAFIGVILSESQKKIVHINFDLQFFLFLLLAVIFVLIGHFNLVLTWIIQLRNKYSPEEISFTEAFSTIGLSQIAKYLPGNFAHLAGRVLLANKNISKKDVSITLLIESALLSFSALLYGYYWSTKYGLPDYAEAFSSLAPVIMMAIVAVIAFVLFKHKINTIFINKKTIALITIANLLSFLVHGLVIYLIAFYLLDIRNISFLQFTSGFAVSFLIGYILPGAPGGIGIREYAFTLLFAPFLEKGTALEIIIIYRIISVLSDFVFFSIAHYLSKNRRQSIQITT